MQGCLPAGFGNGIAYHPIENRKDGIVVLNGLKPGF